MEGEGRKSRIKWEDLMILSLRKKKEKMQQNKDAAKTDNWWEETGKWWEKYKIDLTIIKNMKE